jgi:hypothetical protein
VVGYAYTWKAESGGLQVQVYSEALSPKAMQSKPKQAIKQKTTLTFNLFLVRMAGIKKTSNNKS